MLKQATEDVEEAIDEGLEAEDALANEVEAELNSAGVDFLGSKNEVKPLEPVVKPFSQLEREHQEKIARMEFECSRLEAEYTDLKAECVICKKELEGTVVALRRCIRRGPSAQPQLNFDEPNTDAPKEVAPSTAASESAVTEETSVDESWREIKLEDAIEIKASVLQKLHDVDVYTVGQFEDLRAGKKKDHYRGLIDVKGIGESSVDLLEDLILHWWKERDAK